MNSPFINTIISNKTTTKEIIILGKKVVIENTEDNFLIAKMITMIEKDIKANIKENVIIFQNDFYNWYLDDETIINYEDLTEDIRQTLTTKSRVSIKMENLNTLHQKEISLMMINSNLQDEITRLKLELLNK